MIPDPAPIVAQKYLVENQEETESIISNSGDSENDYVDYKKEILANNDDQVMRNEEE